MIIRKDVFKLAVPVLTEQTFIVIMGTINTIMAGHIGKEAVSAIGMVDSINNIFIAFFSALAVGGTVVVAHCTGRRDYSSANEAARHTLFSGLLLSLLITVILYIFRQTLINIFFGVAEKTVIENSLIYLGITLFTYPLIAITSVSFGVLRGSGDTRTPMKVTITMNILNIILSYALIYGISIGTPHIYINIPAYGVKGAALGIAAARTSGAVMVIISLLRGSKIIKLTVKKGFSLDFAILKSIFGIGIPTSVESLLFHGGKLITQVFIVGMGTAAIAANYIASSVTGLINIPGAAFSIAATTLVGQHMGRGESKDAEITSLYLVKAAAISLSLVCALIFPFTKAIASLYTDSSSVINLTADLLKATCIATPLLWPAAFLIPAGLKGAGDAKYTMYASVFSMWAFRITLGYILGVPLKLGVLGVWMGMFIDWVVRGLLFYIRLKKGKWKKSIVL